MRDRLCSSVFGSPRALQTKRLMDRPRQPEERSRSTGQGAATGEKPPLSKSILLVFALLAVAAAASLSIASI